jgi:catechol 2,3-dioxygenase-like lactoylglutathione lyase family enzyme
MTIHTPRRTLLKQGKALIAGTIAAQLFTQTSAAAEADDTSPAWMHFGICVADMAKAVRFYCDGLGFKVSGKANTIHGGDPAKLLELGANMQLETQFIEKSGIRIELLRFAAPALEGDAQRRPINKRGVTHLALRTRDLEGVLAKVEQHGGTILKHTRISGPGGRGGFVFCTDPDGTRIEFLAVGS